MGQGAIEQRQILERIAEPPLQPGQRLASLGINHNAS
jgi:hypothetical protein